jgi:hypothetical protein
MGIRDKNKQYRFKASEAQIAQVNIHQVLAEPEVSTGGGG